jgi:hypothetical protein
LKRPEFHTGAEHDPLNHRRETFGVPPQHGLVFLRENAPSGHYGCRTRTKGRLNRQNVHAA